jgi:hypothetical protein
MFGRDASTEPRQLWLRGDVAWALACAGNLLGKSVKGLGSGRRCT